MGIAFSFGAIAFLSFSPSFAIAADLLAIKKRGRLIVAVKENVRPLGFRSASGQLQGLEIDLSQRLAQELLGQSGAVELKPVTNQERFSLVIKGEVDIAIAHATLTPSRLRILSFSLPYYTDGTVIITRSSTIQKATDLAGTTVAAINGSSAVESLRSQLPRVSLVGVESYDAAKAMLDRGDVIAFAGDASILIGWSQEFPEYRVILPALSSELLSIVLPKGQQYNELKEQIDQILTRLRNSGWLEERAKYWGLPIR
ncbi:transporter substrate-binding domain-containing protein [Phormidium sp. CLA17]|nr:transporter substrate-binding domain-containing protein [Leptolyngbya sp. Cla-17]